ncbi:MAG: hypothetical protein ACJ8EF_07185 [Bradyrhizobium sp.]
MNPGALASRNLRIPGAVVRAPYRSAGPPILIAPLFAPIAISPVIRVSAIAIEVPFGSIPSFLSPPLRSAMTAVFVEAIVFSAPPTLLAEAVMVSAAAAFFAEALVVSAAPTFFAEALMFSAPPALFVGGTLLSF